MTRGITHASFQQVRLMEEFQRIKPHERFNTLWDRNAMNKIKSIVGIVGLAMKWCQRQVMFQKEGYIEMT